MLRGRQDLTTVWSRSLPSLRYRRSDSRIWTSLLHAAKLKEYIMLVTATAMVSTNDTKGVGVTKYTTNDSNAARVHTKDESRRAGKMVSSILRSLDKWIAG